jgi:endonuclease YncB( thermonuclease family)
MLKKPSKLINKHYLWSVTGILLLCASIAPAEEITGIPSVIDGDTLEVHGSRIRLHGIDAPESSQLCTKPSGERWRCGQKASLALADHIDRSTVKCRQTDIDRYGRIIAVCFKGGEDLNAWMVKQGWAVAYRQYSLDYVDQENLAKAAERGIWGSEFDMPWDWRRGKRQESNRTETPPEGCDIKGNINGKDQRIYHMPGGRWYDQTRIDEEKGERWFCSEQEAQSAGWRRSGQ